MMTMMTMMMTRSAGWRMMVGQRGRGQLLAHFGAAATLLLILILHLILLLNAHTAAHTTAHTPSRTTAIRTRAACATTRTTAWPRTLLLIALLIVVLLKLLIQSATHLGATACISASTYCQTIWANSRLLENTASTPIVRILVFQGVWVKRGGMLTFCNKNAYLIVSHQNMA